MDKRAFLFIILSILILTLYPLLFEKKTGTKTAGPATPAPPGTTPRPPAHPASPPTTLSQTTAPSLPTPLTSREAEEKTVVVETDLYHARLTTRGAVLTDWELEYYKESVAEDSPLVRLIRTEKGTSPLSVVAEDERVRSTFLTGIYAVKGGDLHLTAKDQTGTLEFSIRDPATGAGLIKRLSFQNNSYTVGIELVPVGPVGPYRLSLGTNFGIEKWEQALLSFVGPLSWVNGGLVKDPPDKMTGSVTHEGKTSWTALQDKYFIAALLTPEGVERTVITKEGDKKVSVQIPFNGQHPPVSVLLYAGPKEYRRLSALNLHLEETIDFGWFMFGSLGIVKAVAKPLFLVLTFFHRVLGNYGYAIILITILIKAAFIPMTHKSYKSFKAMQELQPKVAALQKKYQDDKEKLNKEMVELYKTHKVNPMGGCLPLLLQMPVFVALYNVLFHTIELRHAPFIFWIRDLSDMDPFYVLPVIMGASMVLQQKMQPSTMDPKQARMMLMMPVFFTVMFLNFPSGLVLYWLVNNVLSIAQQVITMKYLEPPAESAKMK